MRLNNRKFGIFRVKSQCQKKKKEIMQFPTNPSTFVSNHLSLYKPRENKGADFIISP